MTAACCLTVEEEVVEEVEVAPEAPPEPEPEPEPEVEPEPEPEPEAEPEFEGMWIGLGKGCFVILSQATAKRATNPDPQCADAKASHANATFPPFIAELCFCSCETTEVETRWEEFTLNTFLKFGTKPDVKLKVTAMLASPPLAFC